MNFLDRFFNTYQKRMMMLLAITSILLIYTSINNYQLGTFLISLKKVDDVFRLLDYPVIYQTLLGQFIVYYLDHDHLLWISILSACGLWRVILLSLSLLFVAGKQKSSVLKLLKILTVTVLIVVAAEYTLIGYYGLGALNTTDTLAGVALLTATGSVLKYSALLLMIILITGWIIVIYLYFGVIRKETSGC